MVPESRRQTFWRPEGSPVLSMFRVEGEDRLRAIYADDFAVVVVYAGQFEDWFRGRVRRHRPGAVMLKVPGEVHRYLRIDAPYTVQGACFTPAAVEEAASALGVKGPFDFKTDGIDASERLSALAFAMHRALAGPGASEIERATLVAETLAEVLAQNLRFAGTEQVPRSSRAVRKARDFLRESASEKVSLDALAAHAGIDKFRLVRAFRAEVGVPPYEFLTQVRVSRAKRMLQRGALVADAAQSLGFCDESQLHRHFRRIVGVAPGLYSKGFASTKRSQHRPSTACMGGTESANERIASY